MTQIVSGVYCLLFKLLLLMNASAKIHHNLLHEVFFSGQDEKLIHLS